MARLLPPYPKEAGAIVSAVAQVIKSGGIVALDGRDGAGKTTFGHYIAFQTGIELIQTDHFIVPKLRTDDGRPIYDESLSDLLGRKSKLVNSAVLVDGVFCSELLACLKLKSKLNIRVIRTDNSGSLVGSDVYDAYEDSFPPCHILYLPCLRAERPAKTCYMLGKNGAVSPCGHCSSQADPVSRTDKPWW